MREEVLSKIRKPISGVVECIFENWNGEIQIEKSKNPQFGDFSTNIAMILGKKGGQSPRFIAEKITMAIEASVEDEFFSKVEIAGPGFINFSLADESVTSMTDRFVVNGSMFSYPQVETPTILLEFVSANPTGPLHVGHGRGAALGDTLKRILRFTGNKITTEYYINDVGNQMALLGRSLYLRYMEELGEEGEFPGDHYKGEYLKTLAKQIKEDKGDSYRLWNVETENYFCQYGKESILREIKRDLSMFGVTFDNWYSEMSLHVSGKVESSIEELKERRCIFQDKGALWFNSTHYGDDKDRVIVRANGEKTYFASDIAYHREKVNRGFTRLIDIWGADHHGYISRIQGSLKALGFSEETLTIILVQFVNLIKDKEPVSMSTRSGEFETLRSVINEVGKDAARFFYLMRSAKSHLDFDLDLAKSKSAENPVYYVQYAHARICSILMEIRERGIKLPEKQSVIGLYEELEIELLKKVLEFRSVVLDSARLLEPHRIPFYLVELAKLFHGYYNRYRFISEDQGLTSRRVAMAMCVKDVIFHGLDLIGVSAPERM